jgi:hypothetical protein
VVVVLVAVGGGVAAHMFYQQPRHMPGVTPRMQSQATAKTTRELKILFIGNSYTYYNNMPGMLLKIADSDPDNTVHFVVQAVTRAGIALRDAWADGDAVRLIRTQQWDYVVLQEQSFWAMFPDSVLATTKAARAFDEEIRNANAHTLLFTTWARQPGSHWYRDGQTAFLKNPEYMQKQLDSKTLELAVRLGAVAIPVGDYWAAAEARQPGFPLFDGDGTHPQAAGSYLSALVFYRYFVGRNAEHIGLVPQDTTAEQAAFLRSIARW